MKKILIAFIVSWCAFSLSAQQHFTGILFDAATGDPISDVAVTVDSLRLGAISNAQGTFTLALPGNGPWKLKITHVAYETVSWTIKKSNGGNPLTERIWMRQIPRPLHQVVITSDRVERKKEEVPARMNTINSTTIESSSSTNVDELLKSVPGVYVNRSWGMYSRNASVTMRGLGSASRVLVMLDGVPLNKSGGGGVNWNLLPNNAFQKIEVVKGPASSLYGNNAMTGTINLITAENSDVPVTEASLFISQFNTVGYGCKLASAAVKGKPYFWLSLSGVDGDGYYLDPENIRNEYSSKSFLSQYNAYFKTGLILSDSARIEVSMLGSRFISGLGTTVYERFGNYDDFTTWMGSVRYQLQKPKSLFKIVAFTNYEDYFNQSESINSYGEYKLSENPTKKIDAGVWSTVETRINRSFDIIYGLDYKYSVEDGKNLYLTATDEIYFFGMHNFAALFAQASKKIGRRSLLQAGLRYDFGQYSQGEIIIVNPTALSDFLIPYSGQHPTSTWQSVSPKVAYKCLLNDKFSFYVSLSKGFMPPAIDDMTRSGKIRKGIKIANPFLEPEVLYNAETGIEWKILDKLSIEPSVYYSIADNMIYQVWTGDSVEVLSDGPKPMIQKRNVSQGRVAGAEIALYYSPYAWMSLQAGYSYNHSTISEYDAMEGDADLSGLFMAEVPEHLLSLDGLFKYRIFTLSAEYRFTGETFADDENTQIVDAYHVVNLMLGARIKKYSFGIGVNDLLDAQFIDKKGLLSPGRFFSGRLTLRL